MTFLLLTALTWISAGVGAAASGQNGSAVALSCADESRTVEYAFEDPAERIRVDPSAAWVELQEIGSTVEFAKPPSESLNVTQPLRNAWRWARVVPGQDIVLRPAEGGSRRYRVRLAVHCVINDRLDQQLAWLRRASRICEQIDVPRDPMALVQELAEIDSLSSSISDRTEVALRLHLRAEALAANGHAKDASDAFSLAEEAWLALDKKAFALAAHLGYAEERYAIADYSAVLSAAPVVSSVHGEQSYLSVRQENPRCLGLH